MMIQIRSASDGNVIKTIPQDYQYFLKMVPITQNTLAVLSSGSLLLYDFNNDHVKPIFSSDRRMIAECHLVYSPCNQMMAISRLNNEIVMFSIQPLFTKKWSYYTMKNVNSMFFSKDGLILAACSYRIIYFFMAISGILLHSEYGDEHIYRYLGFNLHSQFMIASTQKMIYRVYLYTNDKAVFSLFRANKSSAKNIQWIRIKMLQHQ